jgi:hypothetical protein
VLLERAPTQRYCGGGNTRARAEATQGTEMNCSIRTKRSVRWFAPAVLAVAFMWSHTVEANEPSGALDIVAAPAIPAGLADRVATPQERGPADSPQAGQRGHGPIIKAVAKPRQASLRNPRVTREKESARLSNAARALWHYSSRIGLILGVGF